LSSGSSQFRPRPFTCPSPEPAGPRRLGRRDEALVGLAHCTPRSPGRAPSPSGGAPPRGGTPQPRPAAACAGAPRGSAAAPPLARRASPRRCGGRGRRSGACPSRRTPRRSSRSGTSRSAALRRACKGYRGRCSEPLCACPPQHAARSLAAHCARDARAAGAHVLLRPPAAATVGLREGECAVVPPAQVRLAAAVAAVKVELRRGGVFWGIGPNRGASELSRTLVARMASTAARSASGGAPGGGRRGRSPPGPRAQPGWGAASPRAPPPRAAGRWRGQRGRGAPRARAADGAARRRKGERRGGPRRHGSAHAAVVHGVAAARQQRHDRLRAPERVCEAHGAVVAAAERRAALAGARARIRAALDPAGHGGPQPLGPVRGARGTGAAAGVAAAQAAAAGALRCVAAAEGRVADPRGGPRRAPLCGSRRRQRIAAEATGSSRRPALPLQTARPLRLQAVAGVRGGAPAAAGAPLRRPRARPRAAWARRRAAGRARAGAGSAPGPRRSAGGPRGAAGGARRTRRMGAR